MPKTIKNQTQSNDIAIITNALDEFIDKKENQFSPTAYVRKNSVINSHIEAPLPKEFLLSIRRPYCHIDDMPFDYLLERVYDFYSSLVESVYEETVDVDLYGVPMLNDDGEPFITYKPVWRYKRTPTLSGLAQAIGVSVDRLHKYLAAEEDDDNDGIDSKRWKKNIITRENCPRDSIAYALFGESLFCDDPIDETLEPSSQNNGYKEKIINKINILSKSRGYGGGKCVKLALIRIMIF